MTLSALSLAPLDASGTTPHGAHIAMLDLADRLERLATPPCRGCVSADCLWEVGMLISPALAHGTGGGGSAVGPLILLAVAIVFVLVFVGQKKWRSLKARRDDSAK